MISIQTAQRQAKDECSVTRLGQADSPAPPSKVGPPLDAERWTLTDELLFLLVHGVLHLIGYDHEDAADLGVMEEREREVFLSLMET